MTVARDDNVHEQVRFDAGPLSAYETSQTVASPGTAVALSSSAMSVRSALILAKKESGANTGTVYVGDSSVDRSVKQEVALTPGDSIRWPIPDDATLDMATLHIDGDNAGDGVVVVGTR